MVDNEVCINILYDSVYLGGSYFNGFNPKKQRRNIRALLSSYRLNIGAIPDWFCEKINA
jgi:hypothetical protein